MSQRKKLLHVGMRKKIFLMHLIMWLFENNRHMMYPTLGLNIIQLKCGDYKLNFSITEKN